MYASRRSITKVCIARAVLHENGRTPHNWACVVSKGTSFYLHREVWWLNLQFRLNTTTVCSLWTAKFCIFILYSPHSFRLASPSHLFSKKKTTEASHKIFRMEKYFGILLVGWFLRIPSLRTCACFHSENFFVTCRCLYIESLFLWILVPWL